MRLFDKYIFNRNLHLVKNNQNKRSFRKFVPLLVFLIVVLISHNSYSQDLFYPEIETILTEEQKIQLDKAKKILKKATGNENIAKSIDRKYAKLERKNNKTNWEKKTWEAKQQRILAERNFQKAYRMISELYSGIITNASYLASVDETRALSLNDEAYTKFEEADTKLISFSDISKEKLELTDYHGIKDNLTKIHNLQLKGIGNQISALEIFINKAVKTQNSEEANLAWKFALKDNTIASYRKYLNSYPQGKNLNKAKNKITELVKIIQEQNNNNDDIVLKDDANMYRNQNVGYHKNKRELSSNMNMSVNQGLIFKVQIAASKVILTNRVINAKAQNAKRIETLYINSWIKYMVGEFNSYHNAVKYRDLLQNTAPDAFIVVFKDGDQIEVTDAMKTI